MKPLPLLAIGCGLLLLPFLLSAVPESPVSESEASFVAGGRYIGAALCKNCHNGADKGDAYDHWSKTPHAKAYETLATDKAKEVAKKLGIDDPQKSEKCLKCHVTAYGVDKKEIKASFKMELGVQCESCHGPGEDHQKKRFAEAMKQGTPPSPLTAEEIQVGRSADTCKKCHNKESPTYQPFCLVERMKTVEHLDPRKERSEAELAKLRSTCDPDCPTCEAQKKAREGKKEGEAKKTGDGK